MALVLVLLVFMGAAAAMGESGTAGKLSSFGHRRLLASTVRRRTWAATAQQPDGELTPASLTTQRWVGAQSQDGAVVSDMSCSFDVPLDSEIGEFPKKGSDAAHYIYCDLHHGWPGAVFGQFVPQLQRGMATSAANETTHVLRDMWLDGWYIQAQYIFSIPPPYLPEPVLGSVGELVSVSPGDHLHTRIHFDEADGAWVLEIGVVQNLSSAPVTFQKGKTSTLKVMTPFLGVNPRFPAPYKGNTSCADYHQFVLGDLHEAWNMNTPNFCKRPVWHGLPPRCRCSFRGLPLHFSCSCLTVVVLALPCHNRPSQADVERQVHSQQLRERDWDECLLQARGRPVRPVPTGCCRRHARDDSDQRAGAYPVFCRAKLMLSR